MKGACFVLLRNAETNITFRRSHWFHTIMITRGELDRVFSNAAMKNNGASSLTPAQVFVSLPRNFSDHFGDVDFMASTTQLR